MLELPASTLFSDDSGRSWVRVDSRRVRVDSRRVTCDRRCVDRKPIGRFVLLREPRTSTLPSVNGRSSRICVCRSQPACCSAGVISLLQISRSERADLSTGERALRVCYDGKVGGSDFGKLDVGHSPVVTDQGRNNIPQ